MIILKPVTGRDSVTTSKAIKFQGLKLERAGTSISLNAITSSPEEAELIDELGEAIDNAKRITRSIKRRQREELSLTHSFQTLLKNYLAQPESNEENLPLRALLQFLKGLVEMINNWICACTLNEVLAGDMINIIRKTIIPEIATQGLPDLINLHQQAVEAGQVDIPVTAYKELFCLTSCIGKNCPWQQSSDSTVNVTLSNNPAENEQVFTRVFDHFEEAISVVVELTKQFERDAQENLLNQSPALQHVLSTLE